MEYIDKGHWAGWIAIAWLAVLLLNAPLVCAILVKPASLIERLYIWIKDELLFRQIRDDMKCR